MMSYSVIFCGTPEFAVPSLTALLSADGFDVSLVITRPDAPIGRKQVITPPPVKLAAESAGIPVFQPEKFNKELPGYLAAHHIAAPDFLIVVAYGAIISKENLALPKIAPINVHGSILPRWRGASPVENAILAGDSETGVTVQIMAEELDAGPILATHAIPIAPTDTATQLRATLSRIGAELLLETLRNPLNPFEQPQDGITFCKKFTKDDGKADPKHMTADEIHRRVRALNPWPSITIHTHGHDLKILEASLVHVPESTELHCAHGTILHLVSVVPAGKKPMSGAAWARGLKK